MAAGRKTLKINKINFFKKTKKQNKQKTKKLAVMWFKLS